MSRIIVPIGSDVYVFDDAEPCAVVQRIGGMEFKNHYEDTLEAIRFFERVVGAAYLRNSFPEYVEALEKARKAES